VATAASRSGFDTPAAGDKKGPAKKIAPARSRGVTDEPAPAPISAATFAPVSETSRTLRPSLAPTTSAASPSANPSVAPLAAQGAVPASSDDERPRVPTARARQSAAAGADRLVTPGSFELPVRLTTPALPLIPLAGVAVPGTSPPLAPRREPGSEGPLASTNGRERGPIARAADGQGDLPSTERGRDAAVRPGEQPAAAITPRARTLAESANTNATAPQPFAARSDAGALSFAPMPLVAAPLMDMAADDPSLHAAVLGKTAHLRLDTGADGELGLHMSVKDGIVDLRLDGAATRTLDIRQNDVRTALAGEGISLGRFETGAATGTTFGTNSGGFHDGAAEQHAQTSQGGGAQPGSPSRESSSSDATSAGAQSGGGQLPSHGGSGGSSRHFEAQDRWGDRESPAGRPGTGPASATSTTSGAAATETRPRRGYHVTA
jgi:hypothetical protein